MKPLHVLATLSGALLLAACAASTPVHYYTLVGPVNASRSGTAGFDIDVLPVSVPRALQRRAMVLRTGAAQMMVQDGHQWAAPLADEFQTALSDALVARLGTRDVGGLSDPGRPVYRVALAVRRFDAVYGSRVALDGLWVIQNADGETLITCASSAAQPVGSGYAALARGAQEALAAVARQIATALQALPSNACPSVVASRPG